MPASVQVRWGFRRRTDPPGRPGRLAVVMRLVAAGVLVSSLLVAPPVRAEVPSWPVPPAPVGGMSVPVSSVPTRAAPVGAAASVDLRARPKSVWPVAGAAVVPVASGTAGAAVAAVAAPGGLPVVVRAAGLLSRPRTAGKLRALDGAAGSAASVRVSVLGQDVARRAGVAGVMVSVARADGVAASAAVGLEFDYAGFANAYGGDYGGRLRLVALPGCVVVTPKLPACQVQTPVASVNDPVADRLTVRSLAVAGDPSAVGKSSTKAGSSGVVYALTAGGASQEGDWTRTSLSPTGSWSAGGQGGDFTYSVPFAVPPSLGGPAPSLALQYSSGSVDGMTAATNSQASWVGEGWQLGLGSIERSYMSCADDGQSTGDLCWKSQGGELAETLTLSLNGTSTQLIKDNVSGEYKAVNDQGWSIKKYAGVVNYDNDGEYWQVMTQDGTQYFFGRNVGYSPTAVESKSTGIVPVFGNNPGEPCYSSAGFASSWCNQAYRWNLDYVVDSHGNSMSLFYDKTTANYGRNNNQAASAYDVNVFPKRIEYGTRNGSEGASPAPAKVEFEVKDRCNEANVCSIDVPWDKYCTASSCPGLTSPTFFMQWRLASVTTQVYSGGQYQDVDKWTLSHRFPDPGAGTTASLWLSSVTHTGLAGGSVTLPAQKFDGGFYDNRVDTATGISPLRRMRLGQIDNGTGGHTTVYYYGADCSVSDFPEGSANDNNRRCFPQFWAPPDGSTPGFGWFHKYLVAQVAQIDLLGGAPTEWWYYEYSWAGSSTNVMWHHDDNETVPLSRRTWSQWRGYPTVRTKHGVDSGVQTVSEVRYFRGMNGDRADNGGGVRSAQILDSQNVWTDDAGPWQGRPREETAYWPGNLGYLSTIHGYYLTPSATRTQPWYPTTVYAYQTPQGQTRTRTHNQSTGFRWTRTDTTYNSYVMPTGTRSWGDEAVTDDDVCTTLTYTTADNNPSLGRYHVGYLAQQVAWDCSATPSGDSTNGGSYLGGSQVFYDGSTTLGAKVTGVGDTTKTTALTAVTGTTLTWSPTGTATYDSYGRAKTSIDPLGRASKLEYTPATGGPVTQIKATNPALHTTTTTLDPLRGQPTLTVDANDISTTARYDALGRPAKVWLSNRPTTALPPDIEYVYTIRDTGGANALTTKTRTAADTQVASVELSDGFLRPRQTQNPSIGAQGGRVISDVAYDDRGLPVKTSTFWNAAAPTDQLAGFADVDIDLQTRTTYDFRERPTVAATWSKNVRKWQTTTAYDGDRTTVTPPDGGATVALNDALGRATQLKLYPTSAITGTPETTTYTYNRAGQLSKLTDAAVNQTTFGYDLLDRPKTSTDPDTGTSKTVYDAAGQITSTTDGRGKKVSHEYDQLGRETARWDGEISTGIKLATFTYDTRKKGMPTSSTRWVGSDQYTISVDDYDSRYQPTGQTWSIPVIQGALAGTYQIGYTYDTVGNLKTTNYPARGGLAAETVTHNYTNLNAATTTTGATSYVTSTTYGNLGELTQRVQGASGASQLTRRYTYDPATMRLTGVTSQLPNQAQPGQLTTIQNDAYAYTATGDITRITDGTDNQSQCYKYDGQHRLTEAWTTLNAVPADACTANPTTSAIAGSGKYPYWDSYSFDTAGRRSQDIHRTSATAITTRTHTYPTTATAAQPVHAAKSVQYLGTSRTDTMTYDNAGNTLRRTINGIATDFDFNSENQFAAATVHTAGGDQKTVHLYDASGGLLIRTDPTSKTLYAAGTEYKAVGSTVTATRYYTHAGAAVAVRNPTNSYSLAADHQASANLTVNTTTAAVQRRWYTPYGADRATQGTWPTDRGFLNKQTNTSTGLLDVGAREYDPNLGTFINPDPLISYTDPRTFNAFAYAWHSPISHSDPTGLATDTQKYGSCGKGGEYCDPNTRVVSDQKKGHSNDKDSVSEKGGNSGILFQATAANGDTVVILDNGAIYINGVAQDIQVYNIYAYANAAADLWKGYGGGEEKYRVRLTLMGACEYNKEVGCKSYDWYVAQNAQIQYEVVLERDPDCDWCVRYQAWVAEHPGAGWGGDGPSGVKLGAGGAPGIGRPGTSGGCRNSFTPDTEVLMADGSTKRIDQVDVGDQVVGTDTDTWSTAPNIVTALHRNYDTDLTDLRVTTKNGSFSDVHTTQEHPFWSKTRNRWVNAGDLQIGEVLNSIDGAVERVVSRVNRQGTAWMYNLTVVSSHTYYVMAGNTPVLVHNDNGGLGDNINLYGDYTARMDQFNVRGQASFEIHVYYRGNEVGIYGSNGFFNKHGIKAGDISVPDHVNNRLKGIAVDQMRNIGQLGPNDNIKGDAWKRPMIGTSGC